MHYTVPFCLREYLQGIRRIVGLTRDGAKAARARAAALLDRLSELEAMPGGPELLAKSKAIKGEVRTDILIITLLVDESYIIR